LAGDRIADHTPACPSTWKLRSPYIRWRGDRRAGGLNVDTLTAVEIRQVTTAHPHPGFNGHMRAV
jgi:hypothetical protein